MAKCDQDAVEASKILLDGGKLTWAKYSVEMKGLFPDQAHIMTPAYLSRLHWEGALALADEIAAAKVKAAAKLDAAVKSGDPAAIAAAHAEGDTAKARGASMPPEYHMAQAVNNVFKNKAVTSQFLESLDTDGRNTILSKLANGEKPTPTEEKTVRDALAVAQQAAKDNSAFRYADTSKSDAKAVRSDLQGMSATIRGYMGDDKSVSVNDAHDAFDSEMRAELGRVAGNAAEGAKAKAVFDANVSANTRERLVTQGYDNLTTGEKAEVNDAYKTAKEGIPPKPGPTQSVKPAPSDVRKISTEVKRQETMTTAQARNARVAAGKSGTTPPTTAKPAADVDWRGLRPPKDTPQSDAYAKTVADRKAQDPVSYATKRLADKYGTDAANKMIGEINANPGTFKALVDGRTLPRDVRNGIDRIIASYETTRRAQAAPVPKEIPQAIMDAVENGRSAADNAIAGTITPEQNVRDMLAGPLGGDTEAVKVFSDAADANLAKLPIGASLQQKALALRNARQLADRVAMDKLGFLNKIYYGLRISGISTVVKVYASHIKQLAMDVMTMPLKTAIENVATNMAGVPSTASHLHLRNYAAAFNDAYGSGKTGSNYGRDIWHSVRQGSDTSLIARALGGDQHALETLKDDFHAEPLLWKPNGNKINDMLAHSFNTVIAGPGRGHNPAYDAAGRLMYNLNLQVIQETYANNAASETRIGQEIMAANKPGDIEKVSENKWNEYGKTIADKAADFKANPPPMAQILAWSKAHSTAGYLQSKYTTLRNETWWHRRSAQFIEGVRRDENIVDQNGNKSKSIGGKIARQVSENFLMFMRVSAAAGKAGIDELGFGAGEGAIRFGHLQIAIKAAERRGIKQADTMPGLTPDGRKALIDSYKRSVYKDEDVQYMARASARGIAGATTLVLLGKWLYDRGHITPSYGAMTPQERENKARPPGSFNLAPQNPMTWHNIEHIAGIGNMVTMANVLHAGALGETVNANPKATMSNAVAASTGQMMETLPLNMTNDQIAKWVGGGTTGQKALAQLITQQGSVPILNNWANSMDRDRINGGPRRVQIRTDTFGHTLEDTVQSQTPFMRNRLPDAKDVGAKGAAITQLSDELRRNLPKAEPDLQSALNAGTISPRDVRTIRKESNEPPALVSFKHLPLADALTQLEGAKDADRIPLMPAMRMKFAAAVRAPSSLSPAQEADMRKRVDALNAKGG